MVIMKLKPHQPAWLALDNINSLLNKQRNLDINLKFLCRKRLILENRWIKYLIIALNPSRNPDFGFNLISVLKSYRIIVWISWIKNKSHLKMVESHFNFLKMFDNFFKDLCWVGYKMKMFWTERFVSCYFYKKINVLIEEIHGFKKYPM